MKAHSGQRLNKLRFDTSIALAAHVRAMDSIKWRYNMLLLGYTANASIYCIDCTEYLYTQEQIDEGADSRGDAISGIYHSNWDSQDSACCDRCKAEVV